MPETEGLFWIDEDKGQVVLEDAEGNEERFKIERELSHKGFIYLLLVKDTEETEGEEPEEVGVLKMELDEEGNEVWTVVDDEEELDELQEIVDNLYT